MNQLPKINGNGPERRWVALGLLTHDIVSPKQIVISLESARLRPEKIVEGGTIYALDAAHFMGRDYEKLKDISRRVEKIFVVGDLGGSKAVIPSINNIELLYQQINLMDFKQRVHNFKNLNPLEAIENGLYPRFLYSMKDLIQSPSATYRVISGKTSVLFAGHNGLVTIENLLNQYEDAVDRERTSASVINAVAARTRDCSSCFGMASSISYLTEHFVNILSEKPLAQTQLFFSQHWRSVIFKSLFRFFTLSALRSRGLLTELSPKEGFLRIYQSSMYGRHVMIDMGGINGYESIYPRVADMVKADINYIQFDQKAMREAQASNSETIVAQYIEKQFEILSENVGMPNI